jgi:hypothetical protein
MAETSNVKSLKPRCKKRGHKICCKRRGRITCKRMKKRPGDPGPVKTPFPSPT